MNAIRGWGQWLCPLETSLSPFLSIRSGLQRATPIDIISDDKGVIYSDGTRITTELLQNVFFYLRYVQAGKDIVYLLHEIRGSFNLRQRISSEDEIYKCSPWFSFPRQNKSCQRDLFHRHQCVYDKVFRDLKIFKWESVLFLYNKKEMERKWLMIQFKMLLTKKGFHFQLCLFLPRQESGDKKRCLQSWIGGRTKEIDYSEGYVCTDILSPG